MSDRRRKTTTRTLELVRERKIRDLMPSGQTGKRWEASGVLAKDGYYFVVFDDRGKVARVSDKLRPDPTNGLFGIMELLAEMLTSRVRRTRSNGAPIQRKYSRDTAIRVLGVASALASFAVSAGLIDVNRFHRLGKELNLRISPEARRNRVRRKAMTREQLRRFLDEAAKLSPSNHALFFTMARTGVRLGELLALRVADVDLGKRTITVERERVRGKDGGWVLGPPKSEHSNRVIRVSPQLADVLRRHIEVDRPKDKLRNGWRLMPPWLFYADVDPSNYATDTDGTLEGANVRRIMRRVLQSLHAADVLADKPEDERFSQHFTPHSLRHTFASLLVAEGKLEYARRQLGHESIKLTCDTYGYHLPMNDTSDCLDDVGPSEPVTNLG